MLFFFFFFGGGGSDKTSFVKKWETAKVHSHKGGIYRAQCIKYTLVILNVENPTPSLKKRLVYEFFPEKQIWVIQLLLDSEEGVCTHSNAPVHRVPTQVRVPVYHVRTHPDVPVHHVFIQPAVHVHHESTHPGVPIDNVRIHPHVTTCTLTPP